MNKTSLVFLNELMMVTSRRSFILTLILVPLASFVGLAIITSAPQAQLSDGPIGQILTGPSKRVVEGYVDQSGLIQSLPAGLEERLLAFADEAAARSALEAGEILGYYLVTADYLQTGRILHYQQDFNPLSGMGQSDDIRWALTYNLLKEDPLLTQRVRQPLNLEVNYLSQQPQRDPENMLTFFLPYGVTVLFYIVLLGSSSLMLNSVTSEKQNRVIEILMTSATPTQMLTGKIIALGLVGLLQTAVWMGAGLALLRLSGRTLNLPPAFQLDPAILAWGLLFFLLGYLIYASLMAGLGALAPNLREASQATFVLSIPLIIPLVLISLIIGDPNGPVALGLSLFPLTAPVTMMSRMSAGNVPVWQILLALGLLAGTAYIVMRSVAGMFRAQTLFANQPFNLKLFFKTLLGRA